MSNSIIYFFVHMAAPPSVSNVRIVGDPVEGITIKGVGDYFGGREGPSKFEWLRKNRDTGSVFSSSCFSEGHGSIYLKNKALYSCL